jgi:hypothetical protein
VAEIERTILGWFQLDLWRATEKSDQLKKPIAGQIAGIGGCFQRRRQEAYVLQTLYEIGDGTRDRCGGAGWRISLPFFMPLPENYIRFAELERESARIPLLWIRHRPRVTRLSG